MASDAKEVATELQGILRVYKDGTIERFQSGNVVQPTSNDPSTGVSSKDVSITADISARLYIPRILDLTVNHQKLPVLVYFRRGFCAGSAFSSDNHKYLNCLVSQAKVLAVSVEYRIAPEHLLPTAYEDSWTALQWVCSHNATNLDTKKDPWLTAFGDLKDLHIGGDSTGANIAHNIAMRAGRESLNENVKILGVFLCQPYFWGSKPIRSESNLRHQENMICQTWKFVYPSAPAGMDNPMVNPFADGAPSLNGLGCSKLLVCVGEEITKERGIEYACQVGDSGWKGEVELYEAEGSRHGSHIVNLDTEVSRNIIKRLASFLH